jgi:hypothetical protein
MSGSSQKGMEVRYLSEFESWCLQLVTPVSLRWLCPQVGSELSYRFKIIFVFYTYDLEHMFHQNYSRVHIFGRLPFLPKITFIFLRDD